MNMHLIALPFIPMIGARENAKEAALYLGEKRWFQDLGAYPWHYFTSSSHL
jgi:hypothetical protein